MADDLYHEWAEAQTRRLHPWKEQRFPLTAWHDDDSLSREDHRNDAFHPDFGDDDDDGDGDGDGGDDGGQNLGVPEEKNEVMWVLYPYRRYRSAGGFVGGNLLTDRGAVFQWKMEVPGGGMVCHRIPSCLDR